MADVAIFHPDIMRGGGGEAVAVHTIDALVDEHSVTLYTESNPDFEPLNQQYGVDICPEKLRIKSVSPWSVTAVDTIVGLSNEYLHTDLHLDALKSAFVQRRVRSTLNRDHDLYVSTANEFFIDRPSLQYIHFPSFSGGIHSEFETWAPSLLYRLYRNVCKAIVGNQEFSSSTVLAANSQWTRSVVRSVYDHPVEVVHPPVNVADFDSSAGDREPGFVTVGAIHESKRQLELIRIIDGLRASGIDTHLHIVGGVGSQNYFEKVKEQADARDYVYLDGYVSREELVDLIESHQYGLHGRLNEHFGIAIAEMVAGGIIPFVPDGGGQTEIVGERPELRYDSVEDAVEKISSVMTDTERQRELKTTLESVTDRYSSEKFRDSMKTIVSNLLEEHNV